MALLSLTCLFYFRATTEFTTALMKGSDRQEKDFYARKLCNLITRTIEVILMHIFRTHKYRLCAGVAKLFKSMKWLRYGHLARLGQSGRQADG